MARRLGLIIGNSIFRDPSLARLLTPDADVGALADVLLDHEIGAFDDAKLVINMAATSIRRSISQFFSNKTREDLLLLYFSGHGILDENGRLYLATKETERDYLRGTAIPATFITDEMDQSRSRRQILVLDCCHSGAFARGSKGITGTSVGTATTFEGKGYGRVVLTASDATQYAWEGDQIIGEAQNSVFTHYLIEGLQTGRADADGDGQITVDELYDYVYAHVISQTPKQTPGKWSYKEQGEIIIARSPGSETPKTISVELPEFEEEIEAKLRRLYDTGLAAYWLEEWERAAQAFQAIVEVRPDYPGVAEKLREVRRQVELAGMYEKARLAMQSRDWKAASTALEAVVAQAPDYRDSTSQLAYIREQKQLAELYAQAKSLVLAEQWYAAKRVLENIVKINPNYPDEDALKAAVDENIAAFEHQKKIEELYSQALAKIDSGDFEEAKELLFQIMALEPEYAETQRLLKRVESLIEQQAEERQRQEKIGTLYQQALDYARVENWNEVLSHLESLRQISPEFQDSEGLLTIAQQKVELARQESRRQELTQAHPEVPQADRETQPWYTKSISYLHHNVLLTIGAFTFVILLIIGVLNANNIMPARTSPPALIGGEVSVLGGWGEAELDNFTAVIQPFKEQTGITVKFESVRDLPAVLATRVQGDNPPDLALLTGPRQLVEFANSGDLVPLNDVLDMDQLQHDYDQGFINLTTVNDQVYGIFTRAFVKSLVLYSPPGFRAKGYQVPQTWDELQALEQQIINDGAAPWCIGLEGGPDSGLPGTDWIEDLMLRTAGPDTYDQWVQHQIAWTDDPVKNAWTIWGTIANNPEMIYGGQQAILTTPFNEALLPMFEDPPKCLLHHQVIFNSFLEGLKPGVDFDFFYLPPINKQYGNPLLVFGDLFGMFNDTPQARALIQYLTTTQAQEIWAERGAGFLSPNKNVPSSVYPDQLTGRIAELLNTAASVRYDASDQMPDPVKKAFQSGVFDFVSNPNDLDSILQRIEEENTSLR